MNKLETLPIPKIDTQQQSQFDRLLSDAEIEMVVHQLGLHKALGPDGRLAFFPLEILWHFETSHTQFCPCLFFI